MEVERRVRHADPVQGQRIGLVTKLDQGQGLLYPQRGFLIFFNNMNFQVDNSLFLNTLY